MRFWTGLLAAAATVPGVLAQPLFFDDGPAVFDTGLEVPGNNPFTFCSPGYATDDVLNITRVDLSPLPPKAGQTLSISATGLVKREIREGAYIDVAVRIGLIKILTMKFDLCEQVQNVDLKCPIQPGEVEVTTKVDLPREIPPGEYTVSALARTVDDEPITCLNGKVKFAFGRNIDL